RTWVGVAAARIRSSGAGRALRCRGGPRDARTPTSPFVLARCPRASRAVRRHPSAACARLRAAATPTQPHEQPTRKLFDPDSSDSRRLSDSGRLFGFLGFSGLLRLLGLFRLSGLFRLFPLFPLLSSLHPASDNRR